MSWDNFTKEEFACKCGCGRNEIDPALITVVQQIRSLCGYPLRISSGYRCPDHPAEARKSTPGTHTEGLAADIAVSHERAHSVLKYALRHSTVTGVGVNQKGGVEQRFVHVDIAPRAPTRPRPHVWSY